MQTVVHSLSPPDTDLHVNRSVPVRVSHYSSNCETDTTAKSVNMYNWRCWLGSKVKVVMVPLGHSNRSHAKSQVTLIRSQMTIGTSQIV